MSITNATRLSDFAAGIGTEGAILQIDNANQRIGIGTQLPSQMLEVAGIVTAQSYRGDGSLLEGITSAGLGTAIGDSNTVEEVIYYTDDLLTVTETTTVNPPASASAAYTQYRDVKLEDSVDLIIETGDDFIPDVLGFGEDVSDPDASGNGVFDEVYTGVIKNKDGLGAPVFANGLTSVGVITATGGFSGNVTGNVTGDVTGSGANLTNLPAGQLTGDLPAISGANLTGIEAAPSISGISSGTLANGAPVILLDDGKLGGVSGSQGLNGSPGEAYYTGENAYSSMTYDTTNDRVVIIYRDDAAGGVPYCKAGTVSGTTISWGTSVQIVAAGCGPVDCTFDSNAGKVVFCYIDQNDSNKLKSLTGTVNSSNNSISLGTIATIDSSDCDNVSVEFCSTINKLLYAYREDDNNDRGFCRVAEVSGTDVSNIGSSVEFGNGNQVTSDNGLVKAIWNPTDQKAIIFYSDYNNTERGAARSVTISGNTPSIGTRVWFDESRCDIFVDAAYDPDNNKIVVTWREGSNGTGYYNLVRAMSLSGTDIVLDSTTYTIVDNQGGRGCIAYDTNANQFLIGFSNQNNTPPQAMDTVTMTLASNGTMTFGTLYKWDQGSVSGDMPQRMIYDPDSGSLVMLYRSNGTGTIGSQYRIQRIRVSNVTSSNFVGFSKAAYTNGQTAKVSVVGSTSTNQTGLTTARQYYVLGDGSLGTTADAANVEAGKSLSSTSLLVKG